MLRKCLAETCNRAHFNLAKASETTLHLSNYYIVFVLSASLIDRRPSSGQPYLETRIYLHWRFYPAAQPPSLISSAAFTPLNRLAAPAEPPSVVIATVTHQLSPSPETLELVNILDDLAARPLPTPTPTLTHVPWHHCLSLLPLCSLLSPHSAHHVLGTQQTTVCARLQWNLHLWTLRKFLPFPR